MRAVVEDTVLYDVESGVARITLNRPERHNAWTYEMEARYFDLLDCATDDGEVRAIVVTGSGRSFCPGLDMAVLQERSGEGPAPQERDRPATYPQSVPKPMIAALNGACAGIGFLHAVLCDLRFAVAGATLTTSYSRRGIVAEFGTSWLLPRLVGHANAMDLLLSARNVLAEEALTMGLVNRVYPNVGELQEAAFAYAADVAANCAPGAMAVIKQQVTDDWERGRQQAEAEAVRLGSDADRKVDFAEGVRSFVEKRPPAFAPLPPRETPT